MDSADRVEPMHELKLEERNLIESESTIGRALWGTARPLILVDKKKMPRKSMGGERAQRNKKERETKKHNEMEAWPPNQTVTFQLPSFTHHVH